MDSSWDDSHHAKEAKNKTKKEQKYKEKNKNQKEERDNVNLTKEQTKMREIRKRK